MDCQEILSTSHSMGTLQQLRSAFARLGWSEADRLGLASSWGMIRAFVFNSPYPTAPFSTLYLFGRGQDIGFQKAIDNSPRKRHHIRFWASSLTRAEDTWGAAGFWLNTDRPPDNERVIWVGAGTRDTGLSLTRLTFQITHATDSDTNAERDYIIAELTRSRAIEAVQVVSIRSNLAHRTRQPLRYRWRNCVGYSGQTWFVTRSIRRLTEIERIEEFCYETAQPSTTNWKHRCIDDQGSERCRLLRFRCVPAGLRRSTNLCRPASGHRSSTSCRGCPSTSCCPRSTP